MYECYRLNRDGEPHGDPLFTTKYGDAAERLAIAVVEWLEPPTSRMTNPGAVLIVRDTSGDDGFRDTLYGIRRHAVLQAGRMPMQPESSDTTGSI